VALDPLLDLLRVLVDVGLLELRVRVPGVERLDLRVVFLEARLHQGLDLVVLEHPTLQIGNYLGQTLLDAHWEDVFDLPGVIVRSVPFQVLEHEISGLEVFALKGDMERGEVIEVVDLREVRGVRL